jgi:release factor glutamine methyltransferase
MKARKVLDEAIRELKASPSIDHWQKGRERIEAEDLLAFVCGGEEPEPSDDISEKEVSRFRELIARRITGEPIPYIKGFTEFLGLELKVKHGVFVPRDSSEFLAQQAIRRLRRRKGPVHVDLATGLGTIALAVANEVPHATVYGADVAADAVQLARKNAKRLGLQARFVQGDMFDALPEKLRGKVDVLTIHPPYVAAGELDDLPDEIRAWEPEHTLTDRSVDGLGLVERTVTEGPAWLRRKGWLLIETDPDRARDVKRVMRRGGFRDVESTKGGELKVTRVVIGRPPS